MEHNIQVTKLPYSSRNAGEGEDTHCPYWDIPASLEDEYDKEGYPLAVDEFMRRNA